VLLAGNLNYCRDRRFEFLNDVANLVSDVLVDKENGDVLARREGTEGLPNRFDRRL